MGPLIGFRAGRGFPPPRGLITAASRYVTAAIRKNAGVPLARGRQPLLRPSRTGIFIKTQGPTAAVPLVPAAASRCPHPSSPSRFLRDAGPAAGWGAATARTQNIDHRKKSPRIASISRNRVSRVHASQRRNFGCASCVFGPRSHFSRVPRPASCPRPTSGV
ncbi:unnamed protein product, partial [Iphiclides podalirius]